MKPSAIFISTVHKIFNHQLLLDLTKQGKIFGYAFEEDNASPMVHEGNVFAIPAIAWCTDESMKLNGQLWVKAISEAIEGRFSTKVN